MISYALDSLAARALGIESTDAAHVDAFARDLRAALAAPGAAEPRDAIAAALVHVDHAAAAGEEIERTRALDLAASALAAAAERLDTDTDDDPSPSVTHAVSDLGSSHGPIPIRAVFARVIADVSARSNALRFETEGDDTEVDGGAFADVADALSHLVRHVADDGSESRAHRTATDAPPRLVRLSAARAAGDLVIRIACDGRLRSSITLEIPRMAEGPPARRQGPMRDIERKAPSNGVGGKYLTFTLAEEEYGVRIENVHEIIALMPITRVPRTPAVVLGVINLRGKIVPVFDLRRKFGMPAAEATRHTCVVVVSVEGTEVGIVVDRVREVVNIAADQVEPSPSFGANVPTDHLLGIATTSGGARLLLAIERVLGADEVAAAARASPEPLRHAG